jgi:hypothetical protein
LKKLKALAIFIFGFGVLLFLLGGLMLLSLERNLQTWEMLQLAGSEGAQVLTVAELRAGIVTHSVWYLFLGLLTMVSGVGLFLLKEWARKLWLGVLVLFAVATLYWFLGDVYQGRMLDLDNLIGYPLLAVLIIGMWLYFTRQKSRKNKPQITRI